MSSEAKAMYAVYDLMSYFSRQPINIRCCPVCGSSLSESPIAPSKAVVDDLSAGSLIPVHDFSRLYRCRTCGWWAVWESWGFRERGSEADFLIVAEGTGSLFDKTNQQTSPWSQALENKHIYDSAMPLPDALGRLFVGGQRKNSFQKNSEAEC